MSKHDLDSATLAQHRSMERLRKRSSLMLSAAMLALSAAPAWAEPSPPTALPTGGTVAAGSATLNTSGADLTVNQSSNRVVIDWRSFNIGSAAGVTFNQPSSTSIAVNRVSGGGAPSQIDGRLTANGIVAILNPNGVLFGGNARVDVGGLVTSTGQIDANAFMGGNDRLAFTGATDGEIVVQAGARLNIADAGLAAFVAPRVRNDGVITARGGRIALGAGETFTLDLAGDRLLELGVAADSPLVQNHGQLLAAGGQVQLSARAAGALVDQIINVGGLVSVASAHSDGGTIVLDGVGGSASIGGTLDASGTSGGTIKAVSDSLAVAGNAVLRANATGTGNGGFIETSGTKSITVADGVSVSAASAGGKAGTWLIDPTNITITSGSGGGLGGSTVTTGAVEAALGGGTNVTITTDLAGSEDGDLTVAGSINATSSGNAGLTLTGRRISRTGGSTINIAGGALTLNVNAVNPVTSTAGLGNWIQDALDTVGNVSGGSTVNVGAGTYVGNVLISRSNISLVSSAGRDATTIQGVSGTGALGAVQIGANANNTLVEGFTILGIDSPSPGIENAAVYFQGANSGSTIRNNRITAAGDAALLNEFGLVVTNLTVTGNIFDGKTYAGATPATGNQFTVPNVSRQLVVLSGGSGGGATSNITFTNNQVTGDSGFNTAVTIDSVGATITGNTFASLTGSFGAGLRARGTNTLISGNTFDNSRLAIGTSPITVRNTIYGAGQANFAAVLAANTITGGGAWSSTTFNNMDTLFRSVQNAVLTSSAGATVTVLPGTYAENVLISVPNLTLVSTGGRDVTTIQGVSGGSALGAVQIAANANNTVVDGFTIIGIDNGNPGIENAAVYFQGNNSGSNIRNNRVTAAGDHGLLTEFGTTVSNLTITGNIFDGATFTGAAPATGDQFTVPNVSRQLVVIGGGSGGGNTSNLVFTNNQVTGDSGLNTAATLDSVGATITGNTFATKTGGFGASLRVRGTNTVVSGNSFDSGRIATTANVLLARTSIYGAGQANFAALLAANTITGGGAWTSTPVNSFDTLFKGLPNVIAAATAGDTVSIFNGTYDLGTTQLAITKSLNIVGQSQAGVIIDGRAVNANGLGTILAAADNLTLSNFTLYGSELAGGNFGIKVQPNPANYAVTQRLNNFAISNVTVQGSRRAELDLNGVVGATITNFTADGRRVADGAETQGAGVQITDSSNVTLTGVTTIGNQWGSVALYQTNRAGGYDAQTTNINIDAAANTFNESIGVFSQIESTLFPQIGQLNLTGFGFTVANPAHRSNGSQFTFFRTTLQNALDFAVNLDPATSSSSFVRGWTGTASDSNVYVGIGNLTAGGTQALSIQTAFDRSITGDTINIATGSYAEAPTLAALRNLVFGTVSVNGLTFGSGAAGATIQGQLTATTSGIAAAGALLLSGGTSLTAIGSNVSLASVDGAATLTLTGDSVTIGAAGTTTALTSLTATGGTIVTAGATTTGTQNFTGATTLAGSYTGGGNISIAGVSTLGGGTTLTSTGGTVSLGTVNGAQALALTGTGVTIGAVGGTTALTSLAATGGTIVTAGAVTTGAQNFTGATTLAGGYTGGGNISVTGATTLGAATNVTSTGGTVTLGTVNGAQTLALTGTGVTIGAAGGTTALTSLAATGGTIATAGAVTTGAQSFTGATTLAGSYTTNGGFTVAGAGTLGGAMTVTTNGGALTLGSVTGPSALTLTAGTGTVTLGAINVASITAQGAAITTAGATTTGAQSYTGATTLAGTYTSGGAFAVTGATTLGGATTVSNTSGSVVLGTVNGAQSLAVTSTGTATIGAVGGTQALTTLSVTGASVSTSGAATSGAQSYTGPVSLSGTYTTGGGFTAAGAATLAGATTINAGAGTAALAAINGTSPGAQGLTLTAGTVSLGAAGALIRLGGVLVTANQVVLNGNAYAANTIAFLASGANATVRVTQPITTFSTVQTGPAGNIQITPTLIGTTNNAQNLVFNAGTGLSAANDGDVTLGNVGAAALRLGSLTVTGRNFTAQTVRLGGDFVSGLSGNQLFSAQTLDTLGAVNARVAGNDTGPIIAGGAVTITSGGGGGGSVQAGGPVTLSYANNVTRAITSTGPVSVTSTAGSISGPVSSGGAVTLATPQGGVSSTITAGGTVGISSSGPVTSTVTAPSTITISSSQPVNVQLNGGTVTVNAPGGTVSGVFGQIVTTSNGTFLVNEQPVLGSGTAEARQIIRDSFLVPAGGTVGSSGEIQLPVGLAIALIAPAGEGKGKRPSIIVNNVNGLGELLRLGYTAIIIDIDQSGLAIQQELTGDDDKATN